MHSSWTAHTVSEPSAAARQVPSAYVQRLRAHSKRAWHVFNGMMALGELDRCYGPLLAAHIFLTRGQPSHTLSQREVARHATLPYDRVKDQMQRLEALGLLIHEREGNRWRTTLLPFLPLADAVGILARARAWSDDQATSYLVDLADRGVRLPWALHGTAARRDAPAAAGAGPGDASVVHELAAAIAAFERGDLHALHCHLDAVIRSLPARQDEPQDADTHAQTGRWAASDPRPGGAQASLPGSPPSDPVITPPTTPVVTPPTARRTAPQHAKSAPLKQNRIPNRRSESVRSIRLPCPIATSKVADGRTAQSAGGLHDRHAEEARSLLVGEGIYPANVSRFASLPLWVIQAAIAAANVSSGHPHRPGRIVERLDAYARGLWRPAMVDPSGCAPPSPVLVVEHAAPQSTAGHDDRRQSGTNTDTHSAAPAVQWSAVLNDLRGEMQPAEFDTWLSDTQLVALSDQTAVIAVPNVFIRERITATYQGGIERLLHHHAGRTLDVSVVIG